MSQRSTLGQEPMRLAHEVEVRVAEVGPQMYFATDRDLSVPLSLEERDQDPVQPLVRRLSRSRIPIVIESSPWIA